MPEPNEHLPSAPNSRAQFESTHWSVVLAACGGNSPEADAALAKLCQIYWYPIYAFLRRRGHPAPDAEDLTQNFLARLLEGDRLRSVDQRKGKFRSFLLAGLTNCLLNEQEKRHALKRGGGRQLISWEEVDAEHRYQLEPSVNTSPERLFDRHWAVTLIRHVMDKLKADYVTAGKADVFDVLQPYLGDDSASSAVLAAALNMTEGAVKVALHRLRKRYGELLRKEVARTVSCPEEIAEEIRYLFSVLGD